MRLKQIRVAGEAFVSLLGTGTRPAMEISDGLPKDAKLVYAQYAPRYYPGEVALIFESAEFEELQEGAEIPIHEVTIKLA